MPTSTETWDPSVILQPAQRPEDARQDAIAFAPNQTFAAGDLVAINSTNLLGVPYAAGGANGTGTAVAISMYPFKTDANGKVFMATGTEATATSDYFRRPYMTAPCWISGTFKLSDIKVAGVAAANNAAVVTAFNNLVRVLHNGFLKVL